MKKLSVVPFGVGCGSPFDFDMFSSRCPSARDVRYIGFVDTLSGLWWWGHSAQNVLSRDGDP